MPSGNTVLSLGRTAHLYYDDGLNLYAYCHNNPISYVDPTGHEAKAAAEKNFIEKGVDAANKYIDKGTDAMLHQAYESGTGSNRSGSIKQVEYGSTDLSQEAIRYR